MFLTIYFGTSILNVGVNSIQRIYLKEMIKDKGYEIIDFDKLYLENLLDNVCIVVLAFMPFYNIYDLLDNLINKDEKLNALFTNLINKKIITNKMLNSICVDMQKVKLNNKSYEDMTLNEKITWLNNNREEQTLKLERKLK